MTQTPTTHDLKPRSREVTDGLERTAARGMLRAVGMTRTQALLPSGGGASAPGASSPGASKAGASSPGASAGAVPASVGSVAVGQPETARGGESDHARGVGVILIGAEAKEQAGAGCQMPARDIIGQIAR